MIGIKPKILEKNGKKEFVVLTYAETVLVSVMLANNVTGDLQPVT